MKKEKGKGSVSKVTFGQRRKGKHSKTRGPKDKRVKKKYKGQG